MNILYESKDLDPKITVENAKRFLKSINCNPKYECKKNLSGTYSATLDGSKWGLISFGKGITPELCEASAYGEFLERLQNLNHGLQFCLLHENSYPYQTWPDERESLVYNSLLRNPMIVEDFSAMFKLSNSYTIDPSVLDIASIVSKIIDSPACYEVPFFEVFSKQFTYLPIEILNILTGSTGECAGNTPEEALVQGLSEILERFAESTIIKNKLTPPEIPLDFIKKSEPDMYNIITKFQENTKGRFSLKIYDTSFGKNIPVVSVILFDKTYPRYRLQSGAHPIFKIALERCLTEIEQGLDLLEDMCSESNFINWDMSLSKQSSSVNNISSQAIYGFGAVPNEWFFKKPSWEFKPWGYKGEFSNKQALKSLLNIFKESNIPVFIRDTTLSELYSYIIYAPSISPFYEHILDSFIFADMYQWSQHLDVEWENCTYDEKLEILEYIKVFGYKNLGPILDSISQCHLATAIALELNDLESALYFISQGFPDNKYTLILKKEIELRLQNIEEADRDSCLLNFFNKEDLDILNNVWRKEEIIYNLYNQPDTFFSDEFIDINALSDTKKLLVNKINESFSNEKSYEYLKWID